MTVFSPLDMLRVLSKHEVSYVIVGGVAARLHGAPLVTGDLDVLYATDEANASRVASALRELDAVFRQRPDLRPDHSHLTSKGHKLLLTKFGRLDLLGHVAPDLSYEDLAANSEPLRLHDEFVVLVASLPSLIEIKRACGRAKDIAALPLLEETLRERNSSSS